MSRLVKSAAYFTLAVTFATALGCSRAGVHKQAKLGPPERFDWVVQPIEFSPPPAQWQRQGDGGSGLMGVYFVLEGGGGQVMSVAAYEQWSERLPRRKIAKLLDDLDKMEGTREPLNRIAGLRVQLVDPLTDAEQHTARVVNDAVDRAETDALGENRSFVRGDLEKALRAVDNYRPSLADLLPHMVLRPEKQQHPEWWVLGYGRDTSLAGLPAYVSYDTLLAPEQKLLYQQVFWVAGGNAFQAVYQGRPENLYVFNQMVASVAFPEREGDEPH